MKNTIETKTEKGFEGIEKSYSAEQKCGKEILKILPKGWKVSFSWVQLLIDADVKYLVSKENKMVSIAYNQNLARWTPNLIEGIKTKI